MHEKRFEGDINRLRSPERMERLEVERVVDLCLENSQAKNILDVGVGTALYAEAFAQHSLQVAGVDANPEMLPIAIQYVPAGDFRQATAEALPWSDGALDLVFLGVVLHEADDALLALKEARRVARQRVCILEWPYREGVFGPPLAHRLNPDDLIVLFQKAGYHKWSMLELTDTVLYRLEV
jgi:ubiquinone/menaquinone biosynthesis C-methylase UbiE